MKGTISYFSFGSLLNKYLSIIDPFARLIGALQSIYVCVFFVVFSDIILFITGSIYHLSDFTIFMKYLGYLSCSFRYSIEYLVIQTEFSSTN